MARSSNQRLKLFMLAKIFFEETDENHTLTVQQLIDRLYDLGIEAERKSLYSDIVLLSENGCAIERTRGKHTGYYLAERSFEMPELKLLADAVACSRFITESKSVGLIKKIGRLTSRYGAGELRRQVIVSGRTKTANEKIYYNVDAVQQAISANRKIGFLYFDYDVNKRKKYHNDKQPLTISPYSLVWKDDNYYCVGFYDKRQAISNFRVDKMELISSLDEKRCNQPDGFDIGEYTKQLFGMFSGKTAERVTMRFSSVLAGVVIDRFGKNVLIEKDGDEHFLIHPTVVVSPILYGWLFQYGTDAEIIAPEYAREEMRKRAETVAKMMLISDCGEAKQHM